MFVQNTPCICTVPHCGELELQFWIGLASVQSTLSLLWIIKAVNREINYSKL